MKIAIFGGSFNPFHIGHAMVADSVIKELGYDKIIFIPTCIPPHKELASGAASALDRLGMVKSFCHSEYCGRKNGSKFIFDSCEIDRGGISYTYDTLSYIIDKYKDCIEGKPGLIMGEEIAAEFCKWKKPDKIVEMADIIIIPRLRDYCLDNTVEQNSNNIPSGNYKGDFLISFDKSDFSYPYKMLSKPVISVSSTEIRNRIASGKSFKYLVPPAVFEYIEEKKLYR